MADPSKTVFLSYRRDVSWALAVAVRGDLIQHGFDVFMDVHGLASGEFDRVILQEIEQRTHFLLLVEPRSFDRISDDGDWLRREIAHALAHWRNVVPVLANGAQMLRAAELPADVARLPAYNAVSVPQDYFTEAMQRLRDRFLRLPAPPPITLPVEPAGLRGSMTAALIGRNDDGRDLAAPRLSLSMWNGQHTLMWPKVDGANSYVREQSPTSDFAPRHSVSVPDIGWISIVSDLVLPSERQRGRWFRVQAVGGLGVGPWSNAVEVHG
jgi:hypothetical protein